MNLSPELVLPASGPAGAKASPATLHVVLLGAFDAGLVPRTRGSTTCCGHAGRGPQPRRDRGADRLLRQHPGPAHRPARGARLRGAPAPRRATALGRLRPPGPAVRAARRGARAGARPAPHAALPGDVQPRRTPARRRAGARGWGGPRGSAPDAKFDLSLAPAEARGRLELLANTRPSCSTAATVERLVGHCRDRAGGIVAAPTGRSAGCRCLTAGERRSLAADRRHVPAPARPEAVPRAVRGAGAAAPGAAAPLRRRGEPRPTPSSTRAPGGLARRAPRPGRRPGGAGGGLPRALARPGGRAPGRAQGRRRLRAARPGLPARAPRLHARGQRACALLLTERGAAGLCPRARTVPSLTWRTRGDGRWARALAAKPGAARPAAAAGAASPTSSTPRARPGGPRASPSRAEHRGRLHRAGRGRCSAPRSWPASLASTSVCFDLSVFELFVPLAAGGTVVLLAENALALRTRRRASGVTLVNTVPSAMAELVRLGRRCPPSRARRSTSPASRCDRRWRRTIYRDCLGVRACCNLYGPSEDTDLLDLRAGGSGPDEAAPADRPADRRHAGLRARPRAASRCRSACPASSASAAPGLARGYLGRPDLTAERFVPDPFAAEPGARLYRTGDLARWRRATATLEFLGRIDHQVKIRGFRIELGEIEAALARAPGGARGGGGRAARTRPGEPRLVAYVVPAAGARPPSRGRCATRPARARCPTTWCRPPSSSLAALPLTPNGKVDRRALPGAGRPAGARRRYVAAAHRRPRRRWPAIWARGAGRRAGSASHDNFFELGGHSLLATQVALAGARPPSASSCRCAHVFEAPTVAELADGDRGRAAVGRRQRPRARWRSSRACPNETARAELSPARGGERPDVERSSRIASRRRRGRGAARERLAEERRRRAAAPCRGATRAGRALPALVRAAAALVPRPAGARHRGLQHPGARAAARRARRRGARRARLRDDACAATRRCAPPSRVGTASPCQVVRRAGAACALPLDRPRGAAAGEREARGARAGRERGARGPFDLARGPLLRAAPAAPGRDEHVLLARRCTTSSPTAGRSACSAASWPRSTTPLAGARPSPLPALPIQYADFAAWQRRSWQAGGEALAAPARLLARARSPARPPVLELPTDRPRPAAADATAAPACALRLAAGDRRGPARLVAAGSGATPFMVLLAAFRRCSCPATPARRDVLVGTPVAGRDPARDRGADRLLRQHAGAAHRPLGRPALRRAARARPRGDRSAPTPHQDLPFEHAGRGAARRRATRPHAALPGALRAPERASATRLAPAGLRSLPARRPASTGTRQVRPHASTWPRPTGALAGRRRVPRPTSSTARRSSALARRTSERAAGAALAADPRRRVGDARLLARGGAPAAARELERDRRAPVPSGRRGSSTALVRGAGAAAPRTPWRWRCEGRAR